jgi:hypothetical protein
LSYRGIILLKSKILYEKSPPVNTQSDSFNTPSRQTQKGRFIKKYQNNWTSCSNSLILPPFEDKSIFYETITAL